MQTYKFETIRQLESVIINIKLKRMIKRNERDLEILNYAEESIEDMILVLKGDKDFNIKIAKYAPVIELVIPELNLTAQEKMQVYFDLLKPIYMNLEESYSINLIYFQQGIKITVEELKGFWNDSKTEEEFERIMCEKFPGKKELIKRKLEQSKSSGTRLNHAYCVLKDLVEEENRRPVKETLPKIKEALSDLKMNKALQNMIMQELKRVAKTKSIKSRFQEKIEPPKIDYNFHGEFSVKSKKVLSDKEWKTFQEHINNLYDLDSKMPLRPLNILEKIELVKLLRVLFYKDEEIAKILWETDFHNRSLKGSKEPTTFQIGLILNELRKKAESNETSKQIPSKVEEAFQEYLNASGEEKEIWCELLKIEIDEENMREMVSLHQIEEEIKGTAYHQYLYWKKTLMESNNYQHGLPLINIILQMIKNSSSVEEKLNWKKRLMETFERIHIELTFDNQYELEASRRRKKD